MAIPNHNNPCAYIRWFCDFIVEHPHIFIVVLKDDASRSLILRNKARRLEAPYITCRPSRSMREFLLFMAEELGVPVRRSRGLDLWDAVRDTLGAYSVVLFDNAEHLTRRDLRAILSFHKHGEGETRGKVPFVLSSGQRQLLLNIEATDFGGFNGHSFWYYPGCKPGKKMQDFREAVDCIDKPIIPLFEHFGQQIPNEPSYLPEKADPSDRNGH